MSGWLEKKRSVGQLLNQETVEQPNGPSIHPNKMSFPQVYIVSTLSALKMQLQQIKYSIIFIEVECLPTRHEKILLVIANMFPDGVKMPKKIVMENVAHVFKNAKDHRIQNFLPIQISPISYEVFYSSTNNVDDYSSCTL